MSFLTITLDNKIVMIHESYSLDDAKVAIQCFKDEFIHNKHITDKIDPMFKKLMSPSIVLVSEKIGPYNIKFELTHERKQIPC